MSDDLIEDAIDCLRGEGWDNEADAVDRSVAEIKRLRDERHAILGVKTKEGLTASEWVLRTGLAERQLAAKDIELARWQATAIDERANQIAGIPVSHLRDKDRRNAYREQAAKELDLQEDDIPTIAYMLGSQKANERLKVLQGYVEQLEKDFIFYARSYEYLRNPDTWKPHQERYEAAEQKAQAALSKIREGT